MARDDDDNFGDDTDDGMTDWQRQQRDALKNRPKTRRAKPPEPPPFDEDDEEDDLPPAPKSFAEQAERSAAPVVKATLVKRVMSFPVQCLDLDHVSDPDAILSGIITSRVPGGDEFTKMSIFVSRLTGGQAWHTFPPGDQRRFIMLATCAYQIIDAPPWLWKRLEEDADLLTAVCGRLVEHQTSFRLRGRDPKTGEGSPKQPKALDVGALAPASTPVARRGS